MMSYAVSQRVHEFGVRMALGATPRDVLRLSLRQAGVLTASGIVLGLMLAVLFAFAMSSALFGLIELDGPTLAGVRAGLAVVSLLAAYVPALRSAHLDPAAVLRG